MRIVQVRVLSMLEQHKTLWEEKESEKQRQRVRKKLVVLVTILQVHQ